MSNIVYKIISISVIALLYVISITDILLSIFENEQM
ncbi:hypothetical protein VSAK1_18834 [Vibrio mediterranei AK1]|nr:hypothetical protein VSAK1_18834 [Vibrio mediterranei AK1]